MSSTGGETSATSGVAGRHRLSRTAAARLVLGLAGVGAVLGAGSGLRATGLEIWDPVLAATLSGLTVWCSSRSRSSTLILSSCVLLLFAGTPTAIAAAAIATSVSVVLRWDPRAPRFGGWRRPLGAVAGLAVVAALPGLTDRTGRLSSTLAAGVVVVALAVSGLRSLPSRRRRRAVRVLVVVGFVVAAAAATAGWSALSANEELTRARARLDDAATAARDGDAASALDAIQSAHRSLGEADRRLSSPLTIGGRFVPVLAQNLDAARSVVESVDLALDPVTATVEVLEESDLVLLNGRIDLDRIDALAAAVSEASAAVDELPDRFAEVRSPFLVPAVDERIESMSDEARRVGSGLAPVAAGLDAMDTLLGSSGPRRYLVLLVTPSEARGGGGFPGSWVEIEVDDGRLELTHQGRIRELNPEPGDTWTIDGEAEYLLRYGRFRVTSQWQNVTMSPDFPTVARVASQLYPQATGRDVDGVLRLGPRALAALVSLTGPLQVEGLDDPLTPDDAYEFFVRGQYAGTFAAKQDRIDYLGNVARAVFDDLTTEGPGRLLAVPDVLRGPVTAGELTWWSAEPDEQAALAGVGVSGAVPTRPSCDTFFVTRHNLLPNKIDSWVRTDIRYLLDVDPLDGALTGRVSVTVTNSAPPGAGRELVGSDEPGLPPGTARTMLTLYSRNPLTDATVDGVPVSISVQREFGLYAHEVTVEIPSGDSVEVEAGFDGAFAGDECSIVVPVVPTVAPGTLTIGTSTGATIRRELDRSTAVEIEVGAS